MASVHFENLTLGYGRHPAVHHLNGELEPGSLTAVVGPNGAGKSTLLKGIVGALKPLQGQIHLGGHNAHIAYLPQMSELDRSFPLNVRELVNLGLWRESGLFGSTRRFKGRVTHALAAVGLLEFEARPIDTLSGGQLQRALFARLLVQDAPIIVLDEPFNALDTRTANDLMAMVQRWHGEERTIIVVSHDLDLIRKEFPQTLMLARELIGLGATGDVLTAENLLRARQLPEAFDDHAHVCEIDDAA
ncbi:MAG: ABC transporter [Gammaproteobacteria bacterium]|nr:ABC transporter [Gammaproteobacteria bacterium]